MGDDEGGSREGDIMKWVATFVSSMMSGLALAAGGPNYPLETIETDYNDTASLHRGMATYKPYCMGCHSLEYQRYERTARDLRIDPDVMMEAIVPSDKKYGDLGTICHAIRGRNLLGLVRRPPDLTMVARKRSPDWVYT
jgi:Cytochrome c1